MNDWDWGNLRMLLMVYPFVCRWQPMTLWCLSSSIRSVPPPQPLPPSPQLQPPPIRTVCNISSTPAHSPHKLPPHASMWLQRHWDNLSSYRTIRLSFLFHRHLKILLHQQAWALQRWFLVMFVTLWSHLNRNFPNRFLIFILSHFDRKFLFHLKFWIPICWWHLFYSTFCYITSVQFSL